MLIDVSKKFVKNKMIYYLVEVVVIGIIIPYQVGIDAFDTSRIFELETDRCISSITEYASYI